MSRSLRRAQIRRLVLAATAALALALAAVASPARAGTYTVTATCGAWEPYDTVFCV